MEDFDMLQGKIADLTKTAKTPGGISLFTDKDKTTYKSTYQLLKDISEIYHDLTDKQQAGLLEQLAGKRGGQVLAGILDDFSEVERAMKEIEESEGSADAEMQIIKESISYQLNALKQTWVGFLQELIDRGVIKNLLENLTTLSEKFIQLAESNPGLTLAGVVTAITALSKILKGTVVKDLVSLITTLTSIKTTGSLGAGLLGGTGTISQISTAIKGFKDAGKAVQETEVIVDSTAQALGGAETAMVSAGNAAATTSTKVAGLTGVFSKLWGVIAANPIVTGVAVAIGIAGYAVYKYSKRWEEMAKKAEEAKDAIDEVTSSYKDLETQTKDLGARFDKLSKGVDTRTNKNISLSNEEYEEYLSIVNELAEKYPQLYKTLDDNGNAIINFSDKTKSASENLQEFLDREKETASYQISKELPDLFGGVLVKDKGLNEANESLEQGIKLSEIYLDEIDKLIDKDTDLAEGRTLSFDTSTEAGRMYFNTLVGGIREFYQALDDQRRIELFDLFGDPSSMYVENENGIVDFFLNTYTLTDEEKSMLQNAIGENFDSIRLEYIDNAKNLQTQLSQAQSQYDTAWIDFREALASSLYSKASFQSLDESSQQLAEALVGNLSSDIAKEMDDEHPEYWVRDHIIAPLLTAGEKDSSGELSKLITKLLSLDDDDINRLAIVEQIQQWFKDNDIAVEIDFTPILSGAKVTEGINSAFDASLSHISDSSGAREKNVEEYKKLRQYTKDFSTEDKRTWNEVTQGCRTATEAIKAYEEAIKSAKEAGKDISPFSNETFSEQVNKLDGLQSAYNSFRDNVENEETKINLDISEVESLREDFGEIEGFDFDKFEIVVTSDTSGIDDIQNAFNEALTAYANYKIELEGIDESNADMIRTQIELEGATAETAEAFVDHALAMANAEKAIVDSGVELETATEADIQKLMDEADELDITQAELLEYMILHGNADSSVWNIDLQALIDEYEQIGLNCEALKQYNSLKGVRQNAGGGAFKSAGDYQQWLANQNAAQEAAKSEVEENNRKPLEYKPKSTPESRGAGSSAGKEDADAYVEAYEKELAELDRLRSEGKITEKQYLDAMRALYEKYFKDLTKYAKQFQDAQKEYLSGMKSLYDSVLSGIISHIDKQISSYQKQKDEAVKAIEAERDAAIGALEEQKKAIEAVIKEKQKQIKELEKAKKPLQDEIDKIREANEERDRQNRLMEAQYNLQKMMSQRTNLIYKGGQLVYEQDTSGLRDAKEELDDAKDEIRIAQLEKQIDLIDKQIEAINDEIELLEEQSSLIDDQINELNEYYDKLIADTEAYWDALIEALEDYKSRWEELQELQEEAEFRANLKELGFDLDAILNMDEGQFAKFKEEYVGILADMYEGNESMTNALAETLGTSAEQLGSYLEATAGQTQGMVDALNNLGTPLDQLSDSFSAVQQILEAGFKFEVDDTGVMKLTSMADEAKEAAESIPEGINEVFNSDTTAIEGADEYGHRVVEEGLKTQGFEVNSPSHTAMEATESIPEGIVETLNTDTTAEEAADVFAHKITDKLKESFETGMDELELDFNTLFPEDMDMSNLVSQFTQLAEAIKLVADALGVGTEGTVGSLAQAITQLNALSLGGAEGGEGIISQFTALKNAVDAVTASIGGGMGGEGSATQGTGGGGAEGGEGAAGTLTSAIAAVKTAADTNIGTGGEGGEGGSGGEGEGGGTAISDFNALNDAVNDVTASIGMGSGGEGGEGTGEGGGTEGGNTLNSAIASILPTTEESLGEPGGEGAIGRFEQFSEVIGTAQEHVEGIADGLSAINGQNVECTIRINIETTGGFPSIATGTAMPWDGMNLESGEYIAKYATGSANHFEGTAKMAGDWGVHTPGRALVGELGQELMVTSDGRFTTIGDKGPEFINVPKNAIIFNHLQTAELLSKGNLVRPAEGRKAARKALKGMSFANGNAGNIIPLSQVDPEKFNFLTQMAEQLKINTDGMKTDLSSVTRTAEDISRTVQNITNTHSNATNITFGNLQFTCTGITSADVLSEVGNALEREFQGLALNAYQRAMAH